jgi:apolipoprotein N-acyltransferase
MKFFDWVVIFFCSLWVAVFSNYAFAPTSLTHLVWLSPWGLFFLESRYRGEYKKLFWIGAIISIFFYCFSFRWILYMTVTFGGFPLFLALPIFFLSAIGLNLSFPFFLILFSFLVKKLKRNFTWIAGVVALLGEFVTPQVFPWYWGSILAGDRFLAQTAEYMSIYGLTFLLFIISYTLYSLIGKSILTSILSLPKIQNPNWSRLYKIPSYGKEIIVLAMFTNSRVFSLLEMEPGKTSSMD